MLRGQSVQEASETLRKKHEESVLTCWAFWIPAQAIIFGILPASVRVRTVAALDVVRARHTPLTPQHTPTPCRDTPPPPPVHPAHHP